MEIRYHRLVQADLNGALDYYDEASPQLGDDFYQEFMAGLSKVLANPGFCHFDACGLRRYNLVRFPYHFLYDIGQDHIRVWVLRHDRGRPIFGTKRFQR